MSRFFDALKQANLSHVSDDPITKDINDFPVHGIRSLAETIGLEPMESSGTAVMTGAAPAADPWVISPEQEPQRREPSRKVLFTALTRIAADKNVRMIPNAVDRAVVEHYRRLRTKIMQQHAAKSFRSLLVTSGTPQEGKTLTVLNLGLSFAMLPSFRVLVVDGDMRRGTLGRWLGAGDRPGFSNLIEGSAHFNNVVFTCEDSPLHFIPGGTSKLPPAELLHSAELSGHLRHMMSQFDLVLMDSPPVTLIADAQLLAAHCEAVLLVARAFKTARKTLEKAVHDLLPFRVIGTVLNGGSPTHLYRGYGGYY
jgi:protein-tyrosine kinase